MNTNFDCDLRLDLQPADMTALEMLNDESCQYLVPYRREQSTNFSWFPALSCDNQNSFQSPQVSNDSEAQCGIQNHQFQNSLEYNSSLDQNQTDSQVNQNYSTQSNYLNNINEPIFDQQLTRQDQFQSHQDQPYTNSLHFGQEETQQHQNINLERHQPIRGFRRNLDPNHPDNDKNSCKCGKRYNRLSTLYVHIKNKHTGPRKDWIKQEATIKGRPSKQLLQQLQQC